MLFNCRLSFEVYNENRKETFVLSYKVDYILVTLMLLLCVIDRHSMKEAIAVTQDGLIFRFIDPVVLKCLAVLMVLTAVKHQVEDACQQNFSIPYVQ